MIEYVAIAGVALWLVHEGRKNKAEQDAKRAEEEKRKNTHADSKMDLVRTSLYGW